MAYRLGTTARNAACDAIVDGIDTGGAGTMEVWTGSQPGSVGGSESGNTQLGTLTFSGTAFGSSSSGTATAAAITSDTSADATGTAAHFRIKNGSGTVHSDGDAAQGSGTMNFDNSSIVSGGTIACSSMTVTVPIS